MLTNEDRALAAKFAGTLEGGGDALLFITQVPGRQRRAIRAASVQEAAAAAERDSEAAAQVIAVRGDWPFPSSCNSDPVPARVLVGEALL